MKGEYDYSIYYYAACNNIYKHSKQIVVDHQIST